jgi:hypothetical protein
LSLQNSAPLKKFNVSLNTDLGIADIHVVGCENRTEVGREESEEIPVVENKESKEAVLDDSDVDGEEVEASGKKKKKKDKGIPRSIRFRVALDRSNVPGGKDMSKEDLKKALSPIRQAIRKGVQAYCDAVNRACAQTELALRAAARPETDEEFEARKVDISKKAVRAAESARKDRNKKKAEGEKKEPPLTPEEQQAIAADAIKDITKFRLTTTIDEVNNILRNVYLVGSDCGYIGYPMYQVLRDTTLKGYPAVWAAGISNFVHSKFNSLVTLPGGKQMIRYKAYLLKLENVPKLDNPGVPIGVKDYELRGNRITVKSWDDTVDTVTFFIPDKMDSYRRNIWGKLVRGKLKLGALNVTEREHGRNRDLYVTVSYYLPRTDVVGDLQDSRTLNVIFNGTDETEFALFKVVDESGKKPSILDEYYDKHLNAASAVASIKELEPKRKEQSRLLRACGRKKRRRQGEGNRQARAFHSQRLSRCTKKRKNIQNNWNHQWSAAIVNACVSKKCKHLVLQGFPVSGRPETEENEHGGESVVSEGTEFFGASWGWYEFYDKLRQKCEPAGIDLVIVPPTKKDGQEEGKKE